MDYGANEVAKIFWGSDFQGVCLGDQGGFDGWPEGGGYVGAGCGAAFLALVLECTADGVDHCVVRIGAVVDQVEILATGFANDTWVASILALGNVHGYFAIEAAEDGGATSVMKAGEVAVGEGNRCYFDCVAGYKLDHVWRKTGFEKDAVDDIVGCNC